MKIEDLKQYLPLIRNIRLFSYLTEDEVKKIASITEFVNLNPGDIIIQQGDINPYFYGVLKGTVDVILRESANKQVPVCTIREGEVFGEAGIFLTGERTADVVSSDDTWVLKFHRNELMNYIKQNPQAGNKILMLIIYSLLKKLKDSNLELSFVKKWDIDPDNMDNLVKDFMID